jgi:sec-independent protein translocase protein TatA
MFGIGMPELVVVLVIIMIVFGAGKLPQIGEGIGKGIRNFKKAVSSDSDEETPPEKIEDKTDKKA